MDNFADLIERLADPDAVTALTKPELEEAASTLTDGLRALADSVDTADNPDEVVEAMEQARALLDSVTNRGAELVAAEEARQRRVAELLTDLETPPETPEDDDDEEDTPEASTNAVEVPDEVTQPVTASATLQKVVSRIPTRFRPDPEPVEVVAHPGVSLVASASGEDFDSDALAQALFDRHRAFSQKGGGTGEERFTVARLNVDHDRMAGTDPFANYQIMLDAGHDAQIEATAQVNAVAGTGQLPLVADGGYCAPGQPIYDFFDIGDDAGLLTLPSIGAPRGSVISPISPSIQDVFANAGWDAALAEQYTEANSIAGVDKACFFVPCPTEDTWTLIAYPICLTFGNFVARAWPEFVRHAQTISMRAARHKVNAALIAEAIALATSTGPYPGAVTGSAISGFLAVIGFYAALYRDRYRMSSTAALDVVIPQWVPAVYAADKVRRDSTTDFGASEAEFTAALTSRGLRPQYVHDWQTLSAGPTVDWPSFADVLLFAPGTLVRLDGGTLDIGMVRDSTLNVNNNFQIFTESFDAIAKIGHEVMLVQNVPTCPTGETGDRVAFDCSGS
jgi:hypothetical protein